VLCEVVGRVELSRELEIGNRIVWRINRFGDRRVEGGARLGYVGLSANAKTPGAANLSSLTLYSTVHNPVRDKQDKACCHAQLYRCVHICVA
jgi:hypothetical protein